MGIEGRQTMKKNYEKPEVKVTSFQMTEAVAINGSTGTTTPPDEFWNTKSSYQNP